jgi:hypothetical protein
VAPPNQFGMQIGADEARTTSYQDHGDAIYGAPNAGESRLMQQKEIRP